MYSPLISVLIPAYNHEKYIEETVRSIWQQKYLHLEIILIDDGSTDATLGIAQSLQIESPIPMTVIHQANMGINATLNKALNLAQGELVALIASDDKFANNRFEAQVAIFEKYPDLQVVFGNGLYWNNGAFEGKVHDEKIKQLLNEEPDTILRYLYTNVPALFIQTCLYKRDFLVNIGGFDETMLLDDWVLNILLFRNLKKKQYIYIDQNVIYYRQHDNNSYKDFDKQSQKILQVFEKYTPVEFRREILSKAYWNLGRGGLGKRKYWKGLQYLVHSQLIQFNASYIFILFKDSLLKVLKN